MSKGLGARLVVVSSPSPLFSSCLILGELLISLNWVLNSKVWWHRVMTNSNSFYHYSSKDSFWWCLATRGHDHLSWMLGLSFWTHLHCQPLIFLNLQGLWLLDCLLYKTPEINWLIWQWNEYGSLSFHILMRVILRNRFASMILYSLLLKSKKYRFLYFREWIDSHNI